jgi:hypothetical protein
MRNGNSVIILTTLLIASEAGAGGLFPSRIFAAGDGPTSVAVADLDGDSVADLVTANQISNDVSVLLFVAGTAFLGLLYRRRQ